MKIGLKLFSAFKRVGQILSYAFHRNFLKRRGQLKFYALRENGLFNGFNRLPDRMNIQLSKGILANSKFSAGMTVSFATNASTINLRVLYKKKRLFQHMSRKASSGIDIYVKSKTTYRWITCISPVSDGSMLAKETIHLNKGEKQIKLFLPPFAEIAFIYVGINKSNSFQQIPTLIDKPILIYGSSITQGCAASRPSLSYTNLIARKLNRTIINMGFSESAKGEEELIRYLSTLNPSVCIIEYDHNASEDELRLTHKSVYNIFRERNKDCLIIIMSRFSGGLSISQAEEQRRIDIIKETYNFAKNNGDMNIEVIYGNTFFQNNREDYFVDDRHPNDLGMMAIAEAICSIIHKRGLDN